MPLFVRFSVHRLVAQVWLNKGEELPKGCGAHVHRWWTIDNIHTGKPVKVCEVCYQAAVS